MHHILILVIYLVTFTFMKGVHYGIVADRQVCDVLVIETVLQLCYNIHFQTNNLG